MLLYSFVLFFRNYCPNIATTNTISAAAAASLRSSESNNIRRGSKRGEKEIDSTTKRFVYYYFIKENFQIKLQSYNEKKKDYNCSAIICIN